MKSPFVGISHLTRSGHATESSTGMASSPGKHPDHVSNFYFGKEDLGKSHEWQQVDTDFPQKGACDPPHSPRSDKAQAEYEGAKVDLNCVTIPTNELDYWYSELQQRMVIGLCHGIRPSLELLKAWVGQQWSNKNYKVEQVQYIPNNYYMFLFEDPGSALQVVGHGQWLIRNTPLIVFSWFLGFNPRGPKPTKIPTWVDFPNLSIELYPWLKSIGTWVGRVLGQRSRGGFIPKWDPQLLIVVDLSQGLKLEVPIKDSNGLTLHNHKILYRNLPNACFHCFKQGHLIKDCPDLKAKENREVKATDKDKGFQTVTRKNSTRNGKNAKQSPHWNKHNYNPLLENVFEPFSHLSEDLNEFQGLKENGPSDHPEKEVSSPLAVNHLFTEQPNQYNKNVDLAPDSPMTRTRGSSSSSEFEDEAILNTQQNDVHIKVNPSFEEQLEIHDSTEKAKLDPLVSPTVDILMTQAEEETLPLPFSMKSKRKKESSKDPNRASVSLAKPLKKS
ncbi:hypothetical protein L7F22_058867 [Adiantum nelumboides]|nr:hypothetical protein [Adiantum nelumboides]